MGYAWHHADESISKMDDEDVCALCRESMEVLQDQEKVCQLRCHEAHKYCGTCLFEWWNVCDPSKVGRCPACNEIVLGNAEFRIVTGRNRDAGRRVDNLALFRDMVDIDNRIHLQRERIRALRHGRQVDSKIYGHHFLMIPLSTSMVSLAVFISQFVIFLCRYGQYVTEEVMQTRNTVDITLSSIGMGFEMITAFTLPILIMMISAQTRRPAIE